MTTTTIIIALITFLCGIILMLALSNQRLKDAKHKHQTDQQISQLLTPLKQDLLHIQQLVESSDRQHQSTMERLNTTIRLSQQQTQALGQKADRLAQALTTENKTQGNFGELRLKQQLDDMGFEEGLQYEQQTTLRDTNGRPQLDSDGHRLQPDVILHFPDDRHIIIDSKVSLTAFEEYHNADTDDQKAAALKRHLQSIRTHINELSRKNYSHYLTGHKLDFVILYIFSENALQLALSREPNLYKEAFDKHILLCSSHNLYALLRVLETSWKQKQQVQNQQEIMAAANNIVERVQMFAERFQRIEDSLRTTQQALDSLKTLTAQSGQSITTAANKLLKYGASESPRHKPLPKQ